MSDRLNKDERYDISRPAPPVTTTGYFRSVSARRMQSLPLENHQRIHLILYKPFMHTESLARANSIIFLGVVAIFARAS